MDEMRSSGAKMMRVLLIETTCSWLENRIFQCDGLEVLEINFTFPQLPHVISNAKLSETYTGFLFTTLGST